MEEAPEGQSSALVLIKPGQKCDISDELSLRYFRLIDNTSRDDRIALPAKGDSRLARFGNNLAAAARRSILTLHIGKKNSTAIKDTSGSPVAGSAGLALATRDGE